MDSIEIKSPAERYKAIADAIREKNGTTELIQPADMPQAIRDIKSGEELAVEYIESTGTQYIDTGYIANQNTRIKCKYQITGFKGDYDTLFSDFTNIQYSPRYELDYMNLQLIKWGGQYTTYGTALSSSGIVILEVNNGTFTFTENGETTTQVIGADTEFSSPYSILLFCNRYYKNVSQYELATCCKARIYYFRIYEGETLVRDFVPAVDENGVICLYDNVTKAYFYNQGTGGFVGEFVESELKEIETLIDESGVLEDTEGSVSEKVEQLIEKAEEANLPSIKWLEVNENGYPTVVDASCAPTTNYLCYQYSLAYPSNYMYVEKVILPNNLTEIGVCAFRYTRLSSVPNCWENLIVLKESCFDGCGSLQVDYLPPNVSDIEGYAFRNCNKVSFSKIPKSVKTISAYAFNGGWRNSNSITFEGIPDSIGATTFVNNSNITDIYCPWAEGEVANAPWGATNATIHYNYVEGEETNAES